MIFGIFLILSVGQPKINEERKKNAEKLKKKNDFIKRMANIALILIIIGFILQLMGVICQSSNQAIPFHQKVQVPLNFEICLHFFLHK